MNAFLLAVLVVVLPVTFSIDGLGTRIPRSSLTAASQIHPTNNNQLQITSSKHSPAKHFFQKHETSRNRNEVQKDSKKDMKIGDKILDKGVPAKEVKKQGDKSTGVCEGKRKHTKTQAKIQGNKPESMKTKIKRVTHTPNRKATIKVARRFMKRISASRNDRAKRNIIVEKQKRQVNANLKNIEKATYIQMTRKILNEELNGLPELEKTRVRAIIESLGDIENMYIKKAAQEMMGIPKTLEGMHTLLLIYEKLAKEGKEAEKTKIGLFPSIVHSGLGQSETIQSTNS